MSIYPKLFLFCQYSVKALKAISCFSDLWRSVWQNSIGNSYKWRSDVRPIFWLHSDFADIVQPFVLSWSKKFNYWPNYIPKLFMWWQYWNEWLEKEQRAEEGLYLRQIDLFFFHMIYHTKTTIIRYECKRREWEPVSWVCWCW